MAKSYGIHFKRGRAVLSDHVRDMTCSDTLFFCLRRPRHQVTRAAVELNPNHFKGLAKEALPRSSQIEETYWMPAVDSERNEARSPANGNIEFAELRQIPSDQRIRCGQ